MTLAIFRFDWTCPGCNARWFWTGTGDAFGLARPPVLVTCRSCHGEFTTDLPRTRQPGGLRSPEEVERSDREVRERWQEIGPEPLSTGRRGGDGALARRHRHAFATPFDPAASAHARGDAPICTARDQRDRPLPRAEGGGRTRGRKICEPGWLSRSPLPGGSTTSASHPPLPTASAISKRSCCASSPRATQTALG